MAIRLASPLYLVREDCERDLAAVLHRLAQIGFDGIEFLGFFGHSARQVRAMLDQEGLEALGNHVPFGELSARPQEVLEFHRQVGCRYLTVSELPLEEFGAVSSRLDELAQKAAQAGIRLLYHNHDGELIEHKEGMEVLEYILTHTRPQSLALEPDLGWIEISGGSCERYLKAFADRCPVIHLKDYYASDTSKLGRVREFVPARGTAQRGHFEFRPTGYGILNLPKLMPLCLNCRPEWFVMDHDLSYERDPYEDLRLSLEYTRWLLSIQPSDR